LEVGEHEIEAAVPGLEQPTARVEPVGRSPDTGRAKADGSMPSVAALSHHTGGLEHLDVLRHRLQRDREEGGEVVDRGVILGTQTLDDGESHGITQRTEDLVDTKASSGRHRRIIFNQKVDCQAGRAEDLTMIGICATSEWLFGVLTDQGGHPCPSTSTCSIRKSHSTCAI
jgi:hypothetical protein